MRARSEASRHWNLDPDIVFLNHGSFGACPRPVIEAWRRWQDRLEAEPVRFFLREWQDSLDHARGRLAAFLRADSEGLGFVPNATSGVNAALGALSLERGDEVVVTDHAYNACRNALQETAGRQGARVVVAKVPFPLEHSEQVVEAVLAACTDRTRLLLLDHITSPTGLVFPAARIISLLAERGIPTLVDGAHAPGMIPLDIGSLGAAWYTGNCHKWLCTPKGVAFLWTSPEWRERTRPVVISHGANMPTDDRSRYQLEFDWPGTHDPTGYLTLPDAIDFMASLHPNGWDGIRTRNREMALFGRQVLLENLGIQAPAPDDMIAALAAVPLPVGPANPSVPLYADPLQEKLFDRHHIQVPIGPWPKAPRRLLRISAQMHVHPEDFLILTGSLLHELEGEGSLEPRAGEAMH